MGEFDRPKGRHRKRAEDVHKVIEGMQEAPNQMTFFGLDDHVEVIRVEQPDDGVGYTEQVERIFRRLNEPDDA